MTTLEFTDEQLIILSLGLQQLHRLMAVGEIIKLENFPDESKKVLAVLAMIEEHIPDEP